MKNDFIKSNCVVIIQARMGSSRLPGKIMYNIAEDTTMLDFLLNRLLALFKLNQIIIATTSNRVDDRIAMFCADKGLRVFRGNEHDVLRRFCNSLLYFKINDPWVYRICADNPLLDASALKTLGNEALKNPELDYISHCNHRGVPTIRCHYGLFAELVKTSALMKLNRMDIEEVYREHVTNYIYEHNDEFKVKLLNENAPILQRDDIRLTVDNLSDLNIVRKIINDLSDPITTPDILEYLEHQPGLLHEMKENINSNTK